ncbi:hypothetical protein AMJ44_07430, partial [candidate division WOR-1 bacterium DG_54_3]
RKDKLYFSLSGKISKKPSPTQIEVAGSTNFKTGTFGVNISASKLDLEKWGNYIVPIDPFKFSGGETDLSVRLSPSKIIGWPVSLVGNFSFKNASGNFDEYKIEKTFGGLSMTDDHISLKNLATQINTIPLELNGRFFDFEKQNLDLAISLKEANLKKIISVFPETKDLDLEGSGEALFKLQGTIPAPSVTGTLTVKKARFYNQEFAGQADLSFKPPILKMEKLDFQLYQGRLIGKGDIDFSKDLPELMVGVELEKIDLVSLSQSSPGIVGRLDGELKMIGPLNDLKGDLSANLSQAMFLGQPLDKISSSFQIKEGEIYFESFSATSETASIQSSGKISRDLNFDFQARAEGIKLSGEGVLGTMQALLDSFQGNLSWKLDEKFFASPLKNLKASGEAILSQGRVGEQYFDLAQGRLTMGEGLLRIENVIFKEDQSRLQASGQTGIGFPTNLKISGEKINLIDLKILNYILPEELKNPIGQVDINIEITGEISEETKIVSLDPLLDLTAKGKIALINVKAADLSLSRGNLNFLWERRRLSFSESTFETQKSNLTFELGHEDENKIKAKIIGIVDFSEFKRFTGKYGRISGRLGANLILEGEVNNPEVATSFWIEDFRFNQISFDKIEGGFYYFQNNLSFSAPLLFVEGRNRYEISGFANLEALRKNQPEESYLDLSLRIIEADLSSFLDLAQKIEGEFSRRLFIAAPGKKSKIDLSLLRLPTFERFLRKGRILFYAHDGDRNFFLESWGKLFEKAPEEFALAPEGNLGGKFSGNISLKGTLKNPSAKFNGKIENGFFKNFTFDALRAKASFENNLLKVERFDLFKKRGIFSGVGEIDLDGNLSITISAKNFPMDILKILFDKDFDGNLDMNATLQGPIQNLEIVGTLAGKNLSLADVNFDKVFLSITKKNDYLFIHKLSLEKDRGLSSLSGSIAFTPPGAISLEADFQDNSLGLLNLFTDQIKWIEGKASAQIQIKGTTGDPVMSGEISIENARIYVKAIDSEIKNIEGAAKVENSQLNISALTGIWEGEKTRDYSNFLGLAGRIDLRHIFSEKKMINLNLVFTPTQIYAYFPNLYTGAIKIKEAHLFGPFNFDFSAGPKLSGKIEINNSSITLAKTKQKGNIFPLTFDLSVDLNKNVYVDMQDVFTIAFSNIFMNLGIESKQLKVLGNLAYPSLLGKIFLKRGAVTIFNRNFDLLSSEKQELYFPYDADKIKDNIALFTGEEGPEGLMPDITITAKAEIESLEQDESGKPIRKKTIILSRLQGVIQALEKERGLNITFFSYVEDKTKTPPGITPVDYSEQEIKVMLMPDIIKDLIAQEAKEKEIKVDRNVVVAEYVSSLVFQAYVLRPVERELEQKFGLESLTLEYNIGKDVRQAMVKEAKGFEDEKPDWRIGVAKGFFDRIYLEVNYEQFGTETELAQEYFNYQLTFKLDPIWSIIYYREPISFQEPVSGPQKVTLSARFSLW